MRIIIAQRLQMVRRKKHVRLVIQINYVATVFDMRVRMLSQATRYRSDLADVLSSMRFRPISATGDYAHSLPDLKPAHSHPPPNPPPQRRLAARALQSVSVLAISTFTGFGLL